MVERQFGYQKLRFKGLVKNTAQVLALFALSILWMARGTLLASAGEMRL
jgi:IS5 family transposase